METWRVCVVSRTKRLIARSSCTFPRTMRFLWSLACSFCSNIPERKGRLLVVYLTTAVLNVRAPTIRGSFYYVVMTKFKFKSQILLYTVTTLKRIIPFPSFLRFPRLFYRPLLQCHFFFSSCRCEIKPLERFKRMAYQQ